MSGVLPKSAVTIEKTKEIDSWKLWKMILMDTEELRKRAVYPFGFTAINRLPGAGHVIAPNTIIIPGIQGCFLIALRTGLWIGEYCFGVLCVKNNKFGWCHIVS